MDSIPPYSDVFVATPTHTCKRYCASRFTNALVKHLPGAHIWIVSNSQGNAAKYYLNSSSRGVPHFTAINLTGLDNSFYQCKDAIHKRITATANWLRSVFLQETKCDYYLSLESDVLIHSHTIRQMISHDVPVIQANCYPGFHKETELARVDRATMGCTLIRRDVLQQIEFRYDPTLLAAHYDAYFAHDCNTKGIDMWYDPSLECEHMQNITGGRGWSELSLKERY